MEPSAPPQHQYVLTVTPDAQLPLPTSVRERLGIQPGDRLVLTVAFGEIRLMTAARVTETLRGAYNDAGRPRGMAAEFAGDTAAHGPSLAARLIARRRAEAHRTGRAS